MSSFAASFDLYTLDGTNGFRIDGAAGFDNSGWSVASAGDVNGDGVDDVVIGAWLATPGGKAFAGSSYVVFGRDTASTGGFASDVDLSALNGANGFRISGASANDYSGFSVASAGDVNGDGIDDLIIGARQADPNNVSAAGASYVVFGRDGGFAADVDLSSLDGSSGFRISGVAANDYSGFSVASAGDVNGDGIDDLIVGAENADPNGSNSGASYVVFGRDTASGAAFTANLNLSALDGFNGFRIGGVAAGDFSGYSVAAAGDVNGDGVDDLIIGAPFATAAGAFSGAAFVVFGRDTEIDGGFAASLNLSALNGTNGFRLGGPAANSSTGVSVASAGDFNGDGVDDLIIGANMANPNGAQSGASYVVFGSATGFAADFALSALDGTNGFRIVGEEAFDQSGASVASAGDLNGDGFADLIIGAPRASPNGLATAGASYVVFGRAGGFTASFSLSSLDGTNGFQINGVAADDRSGRSVAAAGDVNGDGIDDIIIGAYHAGPGGRYSGATYVIYGQLAAPAPVIETGTAGDDTYTGASLDDTLSGLGGNDVLNGLAGDDELSGGDQGDLLYGGDGSDDLFGDGGGDILYGEAGRDSLHGGDDGDKLFGGLDDDGLFGGAGNDRLDGGDGADTLLAGAGNDSLDGGAGADFMAGEQGNDVYIVDTLGDLTVESSGEGYDVVRAGISWTLAANIEALQLQGLSNVNGTGNADANNLQGNAGDNRLSGLGGVDTINGGDGNDIIVGGTGSDLMRGGTGADVFVVAHAFAGALETDQVYDFSTAEGDSIDLSGIDAIAGGADDAFTLVSSFSKQAGQMTLSFAGGLTTLKLDVTGDGKADYQMRINGDVTGDSAGWLL